MDKRAQEGFALFETYEMALRVEGAMLALNENAASQRAQAGEVLAARKAVFAYIKRLAAANS